MEQIYNAGSGAQIGMHVDLNEQAHVVAITRTSIQDATGKGNSYNINTGIIPLTTSSESAVMVFINEESEVNGESSYVLDAVAIGIEGTGTNDDMCEITILENITQGTIIDNAVNVDMNKNRNLGSSKQLNSLIYKGVEGDTFTDGDNWGIFFQNPNSRGYYPLDMEIPRGSSVGIKINTKTTAGTTNVYCAFLGHRKDGKNK